MVVETMIEAGMQAFKKNIQAFCGADAEDSFSVGSAHGVTKVLICDGARGIVPSWRARKRSGTWWLTALKSSGSSTRARRRS